MCVCVRAHVCVGVCACEALLLIADAATGVEDFYSVKELQIVMKPRFHPLLCQFFLMKIIIVINPVCVCVGTSAEGDDFPRL